MNRKSFLLNGLCLSTVFPSTPRYLDVQSWTYFPDQWMEDSNFSKRVSYVGRDVYIRDVFDLLNQKCGIDIKCGAGFNGYGTPVSIFASDMTAGSLIKNLWSVLSLQGYPWLFWRTVSAGKKSYALSRSSQNYEFVKNFKQVMRDDIAGDYFDQMSAAAHLSEEEIQKRLEDLRAKVRADPDAVNNGTAELPPIHDKETATIMQLFVRHFTKSDFKSMVNGKTLEISLSSLTESERKTISENVGLGPTGKNIDKLAFASLDHDVPDIVMMPCPRPWLGGGPFRLRWERQVLQKWLHSGETRTRDEEKQPTLISTKTSRPINDILEEIHRNHSLNIVCALEPAYKQKLFMPTRKQLGAVLQQDIGRVRHKWSKDCLLISSFDFMTYEVNKCSVPLDFRNSLVKVLKSDSYELPDVRELFRLMSVNIDDDLIYPLRAEFLILDKLILWRKAIRWVTRLNHWESILKNEGVYGNPELMSIFSGVEVTDLNEVRVKMVVVDGFGYVENMYPVYTRTVNFYLMTRRLQLVDSNRLTFIGRRLTQEEISKTPLLRRRGKMGS